MVISRSVITPPETDARIARHRLDARLGDIAAARVVLVRAPAGYGKTVAVASWADRLRAAGRPVLWVSPRAGVATPEQLLEALGAAARAAGLTVEKLVPGTVARDLLGALSADADARPVIVIDDVQRLSRAASAILDELVQCARDTVTLILTGRNKPYLPLARLRSMERLVEVGPEELAMDAAEVAGLTAVRLGGLVDLDEAEALVRVTEGWPAGVMLALRRQIAGFGLASALVGHQREVRQFFAEEVTADAVPSLTRFLTDSAILDRLTPQACAAVTGEGNSLELLETAARNGMFLTCIDEQEPAWALHPLFRQTLYHVLTHREAGHFAALNLKAARYFRDRGMLEQAIAHAAQADDPQALGELLEQVAEPLTYSGFISLVVAHAEPLPWPILSQLPMTLLTLAWFKIRRLSFSSAQSLIDAAERCLDTRPDDPADPSVINLRRLVRHRRFLLAAAKDDMPLVEREAELLLAEFGDDSPYLSCTILAQLMSARRELYHFHDALRLQAETRRALARPGSDFASIPFKSAVAPGLVGQGKTDAAVQLLEEALDTAGRMVGARSGVAALAAMPLAEICYDRGDLPRASALIGEHLAQVREWGFVDHLLSGHLVQAKLMVADGRIEDAIARLEEAQLTAIECGLERLRVGVIAEQVRLLLRLGRVADAQHLFGQAGVDPAALVPSVLSCRRDELFTIAWIRLEMRADRLSSARKVARHWREFVRRNGAVQSAVRFELLLTEIAVLAGDRSEARRAIREAVSLAAPNSWRQMILDEGEIVTSLLVEAYADSPALEGPADRFAQSLVAALSADETSLGEEELGLGGQLVPREIQILAMVAGGLRNREIGDRLGLTEGTVKWYMQQVYDKLGVRRRAPAVARARQLGLL